MAHVLLHINQYTIFEVPCFTDSKYIIEAKIKKNLFGAPVGRPRWNLAAIFGVRKLVSMGYRMSFLCDSMFSRFGTVRACEGQRDR